MFDPAKTSSKAVYKHSGKLLSLAGDLSHRRLFAGSSDYAVHVFDLSSEKKEPVGAWRKHENYVSALAVVAGGDALSVVSGSYDRRLIWWNAETGDALREVDGHQGWIRDLTAVGDGKQIASCGDDMLVKLWDAQTGGLIRVFEGHAKRTPQDHVTALYVVVASPDGKYLASGDRIGEVRVWEVETGKLAQSLQIPILYTYDERQRKRSIGGIRALAFSPDGKLLAVGGIGQVGNVDGLEGRARVECWDWQTNKPLFASEAQGHKGIINQLRYWPDGSWLIGGGGGSDNGLLAFWKSETPSDEQLKKDKDNPVPMHKFKAEGHVHRVLLNAEANELYAAGHGKLEIWGLG